jgi:thiosulfate/3-mercaptopyruvate sulfurtransferase
LTNDIPQYKASQYPAPREDFSMRAYLADVQTAVKARSKALVDVRSPKEFSGEILAPPGFAGDFPARRPHSRCAQHPVGQGGERRRHLQERAGTEGHFMTPRNRPIISCCRMGERSSHTWFVLKYLLGYQNVVNYDGSWTEWGNLVGAPVERTARNPQTQGQGSSDTNGR